MKDGVRYKRKLIGARKNHLVTLPPAIVEYLGIKYGDKLMITPEKGKYGKFVAIWYEEEGTDE